LLRYRRRLYYVSLMVVATSVFAESPGKPAAPVARVEIVVDSYFGEQLTDRYRWMENDKDPGWLPFLEGQNNHTRAVLDALPLRDALLKRIEQLSGEIAAPASVQRAGGRIFFQQRPAGANNFKLFVREQGSVRLLVDPSARDTTATHFSLDWWEASPEGDKVTYGISNLRYRGG